MYQDCYVTTAEILRPKKKQKVQNLSTITLAYLHSKKNSKKQKHVKIVRVLFDTGCGATLIHHSLVKNLKQRITDTTTWKTKAGSFRTSRKCKINFSLPAFHENREITWNAYVDESESRPNRYDMIIGRDLLHEVGIDFLFSEGLMTWDNVTVPMKSPEMLEDLCIDELEQELLFIHDPTTTDAERIKKILDTKYAPADLQTIVEECNHLQTDERKKLLALLSKFKPIFDGTLGHWKTEPVDLELKDPNGKPFHTKPYPVSYSQEKKLREEVDRMCEQKVLRKINRSEYASPMFTISKPDGTLRSLADLRELNKRIKRKPYPIPKIQDMLLKLEGFLFATSLDLNMGYYHIELTPNAAHLCTAVLPWGKYEYVHLPMGLCNSPDIFQEKMTELMEGLEFARAYLDDLLIISKMSFDEHLEHLDQVFTRLLDAGLKVNASKSSFCQPELKYLGYWITRQGIKPLPQKVEAIHNIATPKTRRQLQCFIGMINYY